MSQAITLQADLTVTCNRPGGPRVTIPSGTVITFPDAVAGTFTGRRMVNGIATGLNFATALCAAADFLREIGGRDALAANISEFDNQTVDGVTYLVSFGPDGQATFDSQGVSSSASPSASPSPSSSPSASASASPSASASSTPSASPSSSRSASPSASSDARLKQNIESLGGALDKLAGIRGVSYQWNEDSMLVGKIPGTQEIGVIAQEVEAVYPELVTTDEMGYLRVNYNGLVGVLFAAIRELNAKLEARETQAEHRHFVSGEGQEAR
jgi:hypothetical protein